MAGPQPDRLGERRRGAMAARGTLNIGLVGCGFMGRTHSNAFRQAPAASSSLPRTPVLKAVCARNADSVTGLRAPPGATSRSRPTGARWSRATTSISSTSPRRTTPMPRSPLRPPRPARWWPAKSRWAARRPRAARMVEAVETAGVANMVWYNYRRVPAVTLAKRMIDEGRLGRMFHYRAKFLQDWTMSRDLPQGGAGLWRLDAAVAGSGVTGDLLAHCIDAALWLNGEIADRVGHDRDLHQGADARADRRAAAGVDRRRQRLPGALPQRLARDLRGHPLRPRPQGAEHLRDQRRARLARLGPARPAQAAVLRSPRRGPAARLALDPRQRFRSPLHEHWWVPGPADRLRAHLHPPDGGFPVRAGRRPTPVSRHSATPGDGPGVGAVLASARERRWVGLTGTPG